MSKEETLGTTTIYGHLDELRKMLIWSGLFIIVGTMISYAFFLDFLMAIVCKPITDLGKELVFISVGEGFISQIKVAVLGGVIISFPLVFWQLVKFVSPALYANEKRIFFTMFFISPLLFCAGITFGYFYVIGLGLRMLLITLSASFTPMISVSAYISFVFWFLFPFGLVFEIPVVTYTLSSLGLITPEFLIKRRKHVIFVMFVVAAVLTPPDVITQVLLAFPMVLLYEISIWISRLAIKLRRKRKVLQEQAQGL